MDRAGGRRMSSFVFFFHLNMYVRMPLSTYLSNGGRI